MDIELTFYQLLNFVVAGINFVGITIVFWGFVVAAIGFMRIKLHRTPVDLFLKETNKTRAVLGIYILFGLEFMIAADIIRTFIRPTQEDLIVLGSIVVIRTVISYFLEREVDKAQHNETVEKGSVLKN